MATQIDTNVIAHPAIHPRIIIQPDWSSNLKLNTLPADAWLEFKSSNDGTARLMQNIHGVCSIKALTEPEAKGYKVSAGDNFQATDIDRDQKKLRIKIRDADFSHTFQGPIKSFATTGKPEDDEINIELDPLIHVPELPKSRIQQAQLSAHPHWFDISSGGVGLTALSNGRVTIWDIENGSVRRKLKGHVEDVYISRFFPSDFAVVSGGADMRVKIWSLDSDNDQIRDTTLTGHRSRINDVLALDQQRVLSASNDGSVILWDINKDKQMNKIVQLDNDSIHCISLIGPSLIACASNDGLIRFYDLNSKENPNEIKVGSSVSALCCLSEVNQLIYGTEQSIIGIYDIRQLNPIPIHTWKEQRGKITSIVPSKDQSGILTTTADGSCFEYNKEELQSIMDVLHIHVHDFTGADDVVLNAKVYNNRIYSICRDGLLRVYENFE